MWCVPDCACTTCIVSVSNYKDQFYNICKYNTEELYTCTCTIVSVINYTWTSSIESVSTIENKCIGGPVPLSL